MTTADRAEHRASEDRYRERWKWDAVTWGCHAVDCYPGGCPFRVYTRNGKIVREEQASPFPTMPAPSRPSSRASPT
jgi:nitrate reductase alpha subunit